MAESRKRKISDSPVVSCEYEDERKHSRRDLIPAPSSEEKAQDPPWGQYTPPDILLKIFEELLWGGPGCTNRVTDGHTVLKLLRLSHVCRLWREVSTHPALWQRIKLPNPVIWFNVWIRHANDTSDPQVRGKEALQFLCENKLGRTQHLTLEGWENLTDSDIKMVVEGCRNLHTLRLRHCTALSNKTLDVIADGLPLLRHLDVGSTRVVTGRKRLIPKFSLTHLTTKLGSQLKSLNLSRSVFSSKLSTDPTALAEALSKCCQLEVLQLKKCCGKLKLPERKYEFVFLLDIERLQAGCPKLRVLDLSHSAVQLPDLNAENEKLSPGFQDLEEYRSCDKTKETLLRVIRGASNLRTLNLKWAKLRELGTLPCTALEKIVLPKRSPSPSLIQHISQWEKTLQIVDMADINVGYPIMKLSDMLSRLLKPGRFHSLRKLDATHTLMTRTGLRIILKYCPSLKWMDLSYCDSLEDDDKPNLEDYATVCKGKKLEKLKCRVLHGCCNRPLLCKYCHGKERRIDCRCDVEESSESEYEDSSDEFENSDYDEEAQLYDYDDGYHGYDDGYDVCVLM